MKRFIIIIVAVFSLISFVNAQSTNREYDLLMKTGNIPVQDNLNEHINFFQPTGDEIVQGYHYKLIQFYQIPDAALMSHIKSLGVILMDYLPQKAFYAAIPVEFDKNSLRDINIRSIINIRPEFKMAPSILEEEYPQWAVFDEYSIKVFLHYFENIEQDYVINHLDAFIIETIQVDNFSKNILCRVKISDLELIAGLPFVIFIEPVYPEPTPENYTGRTLHRSNVIATDFATGRHYDGSSVHIMLQDDGTIGPHIDYQGRIGDQFLTNNWGDHGDHVAGIIMGAGNLDPKVKGMAFGSTLFVYGAAPTYPGFAQIPTHYGTYDIRITSTSYSNGCNAGYTSLARTMDMQINMYPSLMHVFSAGNSGTDDCGYGAGPGWGNVTGGHKIAKNVIAVANLSYVDQLATSSSRGPAHDGRIKPDISAKGTDVNSTTNPNDYTIKSGTSMSCPGVSGTLAQLYQAYKELNVDNDPMAGLIKSVLLNSADDLGNQGPDFLYGWGRMNALRAVNILEVYNYDSASVGQGQVITHEVEVPGDLKQLKVMIYWTDYQAAVNADKALVNDLDLILTDPSSNDFYPWILDHTPDPALLNNPAIRGIDHLNNMEQVTIDDPEPGLYSLTVEGFEVPYGAQTYSVIYDFRENELTLTYPIGGESFVPGEIETIRWDAFGNDDPFMLEYSFDDGQTWNLISDNIDANNRYYNWTTPNSQTGKAHIRVIRASQSSLNEVAFSIMTVPQNLMVDWTCNSSFHIHWDEVFGATGYEVSLLGEKYMDPAGTTNQTSFIIDGFNVFTEDWFSVKALGPDGASSRRAVAALRNPGLFSCYPQDAKMENILLTDWGYYCESMNLYDVPVEVKIKNFGEEEIADFLVSYQLNDGDIFSETFSGSLDPDSSVVYSFEELIDISESGTYFIKAWVSLDTDDNPGNDTINSYFEVLPGNILPAPFIQTFDAFEICSSFPTCELVTCDLSEGWVNAENLVFDDIDWRTFQGPTTTYGTGPVVDHTTGTTEGKYLYLEPSVLCFSREASLISPCIDLQGMNQPYLNFWFHAYGKDIGRLQVDLLSGTTIHKDIMMPIIGEQGNVWQEGYVDLSAYSGQKIALRFRGYTAIGQKGDLAIDDLAITDIEGISHAFGKNPPNLHLYPNPGTGYYFLSVADIAGNPVEINITDMFGKVIYNRALENPGKAFNYQIDISNVANGIYLLTLLDGDTLYRVKLSKR